MTDEPAYGLWSLVVINSLVFIIFAFSFSKPRTARDWRSFSAFSGFVVALFVEMYGFPLTIYLLSGWLVNRHPGVDLFFHDAGHLWNTLLGWKVNPHFDPLHILSNVLILCGFIFTIRRVESALRSAAHENAPRQRGRMRMFATRNTMALFSSCSAFCCSGRHWLH